MDILIKITDEYDVGQTMFFRALFGLIPIFFLIPKNRIKDFYKTKNIGFIFIDLFLELLQWQLFLLELEIYSLQKLHQWHFSAPLWVVLFSIFF